MSSVLFWIFASLTVVSALGVVTMRSATSSAMSLVATFFFLAGLYVLLWAHTIAVLQVLVYAGAIMVLFLFVIMLLSITDSGPGKWSAGRMAGGLVSMLIFMGLLIGILKYPALEGLGNAAGASTFGNLEVIGALLYTQYLLPFEAVSLLLLVAMVGAVVVAKPRI